MLPAAEETFRLFTPAFKKAADIELLRYFAEAMGREDRCYIDAPRAGRLGAGR